MNLALLAVLLAVSSPSRAATAEADHFEPAALPGETKAPEVAAPVAVSSASARLEATAADMDRPGIAVDVRPAWTSVKPARKAWSGPKRLELLPDQRAVVERETIDGVSVLKHKSSVPASMAAVQTGTAAKVHGWAINAGQTSARLIERNEVLPMGQRNLWELTMPDGSKRMVRASPLVFDLVGGGVRTSGRTVLYDLYGTGNKQRMEWINDIPAGMGLLVFDAEKTGVSGENGLGLFGDSTDLDGDGKADGFLDGFKALRAFVAKAIREQVIPGSVWGAGILGASDLGALEKAYGLKMRVGGLNGPAKSLAAAGIAAISFTGAKVETAANFDGQGNDAARQEGAVFLRRDGTTGAYEDVWFKPKNNVMVKPSGS